MIPLRIVINKNPKLLQKFYSDPDSDIIIRCKGSEFRLQMAFLELESEYFDEIRSKGHRVIDLHNLNQPALEDVLKVLYGGEILISDLAYLQEVFEVVRFLKINVFRDVVEDELREHLKEMSSIGLIQFLYQNNILVREVEEVLVESDLEVLRDPKHSMELNRLSSDVLNVILLDYLKAVRKTDPDRVKEYVNEVLADYFHASKKRAEYYFSEYNIEVLKEIWFQAHPVYQSLKVSRQSEIMVLYERTIKNLSQRVRELREIAEGKKQKLGKLMQVNKEAKARLKEREIDEQMRSMKRSRMYESAIQPMPPVESQWGRTCFYPNEPVSLTSTYESTNSQYNKKISFPEITLSSLFSSSSHRKRSE